MGLQNIQFFAIFCASIFLMVVSKNLALSKQARLNRGPLTLRMTGTTIRNSRMNICFIKESSSNACKMTFSSAHEQQDEVFPITRIPVTVDISDSIFDHSYINICIIDGSSNKCDMRSPRLLDFPIVEGISTKLSPTITINGTSSTESFINLYIREEGDIYQCTISGGGHHFCYMKSLSNDLSPSAVQRGPILITITGSSYNNRNVDLCIYTGHSGYSCTITGNSYSGCKQSNRCNMH